jgi:hypothetical protein
MACGNMTVRLEGWGALRFASVRKGRLFRLVQGILAHWPADLAGPSVLLGGVPFRRGAAGHGWPRLGRHLRWRRLLHVSSFSLSSQAEILRIDKMSQAR